LKGGAEPGEITLEIGYASAVDLTVYVSVSMKKWRQPSVGVSA
jgi:hypothetical protein